MFNLLVKCNRVAVTLHSTITFFKNSVDKKSDAVIETVYIRRIKSSEKFVTFNEGLEIMTC